VQRPVDRELALLVEDRDQRLALDQLHDEEGELRAALVLGLAVVVDRGDVGVGQRRRCAGASLRKRATKLGSPVNSLRSTLAATTRSRTRSRARHTSPMPPVAMGAVIS
jgi:hypothetical protein